MNYSVPDSHLCFLLPVFCCSLVEIAVLLLASWQSQANFSTGLQTNTLWCLVFWVLWGNIPALPTFSYIFYYFFPVIFFIVSNVSCRRGRY
jgi:hypothetical protein